MRTIKLTGRGASNELQPYYLLNPTNVVVTTGVVQKLGPLKDAQDNPIPIEEVKTFVHISGKPLIVEETVEEILGQMDE